MALDTNLFKSENNNINQEEKNKEIQQEKIHSFEEVVKELEFTPDLAAFYVMQLVDKGYISLEDKIYGKIDVELRSGTPLETEIIYEYMSENIEENIVSFEFNMGIANVSMALSKYDKTELNVVTSLDDLYKRIEWVRGNIPIPIYSQIAILMNKLKKIQFLLSHQDIMEYMGK